MIKHKVIIVKIFAIKKTKIYVFYSQIKIDFFKLIIQILCFFNFIFHSIK